MCSHFEVPCDPTNYFQDWYLVIGYDLAQGHNFDMIKVRNVASPLIVQIAEWLEAHFEATSWHEQRSHPRSP
jgi:hypothetical protein